MGCFTVLWLFLTVPWVSLQYVIVVFSNPTHLLFLEMQLLKSAKNILILKKTSYFSFLGKIVQGLND